MPCNILIAKFSYSYDWLKKCSKQFTSLVQNKGTCSATSWGDKSYHVNQPFLNLHVVAGTKIWSLQLQIALNFLGPVPVTCFSKHVGWTVHETSPCDLFLKTLRVNCSWDKSLRLVPQNASCEVFMRQVPVTCSSKRFVWTVHETSPCDQSPHVYSSVD